MVFYTGTRSFGHLTRKIFMKTLYELSTNYPIATHTTMEWRQREMTKIKCLGCNGIAKNWYPRPIDVILRSHPGNKICGSVDFTVLTIFHIDFINQIRSYLDAYIIGKCLLPDGKVIKEYVTCYTNKLILVRGNKERRYGDCQDYQRKYKDCKMYQRKLIYCSMFLLHQ